MVTMVTKPWLIFMQIKYNLKAKTNTSVKHKCEISTYELQEANSVILNLSALEK